MGKITEITAGLQDIGAAIEQQKNAIAKTPDLDGLKVSLASLEKRQQHLEQEFEQATNREYQEIISYRLIPEQSENLPLRAVTTALEGFQRVVSTMFDAKRNGPKIRARLSPEMVALSGFDFAYTYSGSLGIVLTVANERLLLGETDLDVTISKFFSAAKLHTRDEVKEFAHEFGVASVRGLYGWIRAHAQHGLSADVQWRREASIRDRLTVEPAELRVLQGVIEETSDTVEEKMDIPGILVGLDTSLKTFHLQVPDAQDIRGSWGDDFAYSSHYVLNSRYRASLVKQSITHYALDKEDTFWTLAKLQDPSQEPEQSA